MIISLSLQNFQSHDETELEFHEGVNSIIGSSDSGKTAILRSLNWVVNNRPAGTSFVSNWAKNSKGKQTENTVVSVDMTGEKFVKRIRGPKDNKYTFCQNDSPDIDFEALRSEVPEELQKYFNLSEVNIQKQMDAPFLLSESAGEVARFFNRIIKLDVIDQMLYLVESKKRKAKRNHEGYLEKTKQLEEKIKCFDWLEDAEKLIDKINNLLDKLVDQKAEFDQLNRFLDNKSKIDCSLEDNEQFIDQVEPLMLKIEKINSKLEETKKSETNLNRLFESYTSSKEITEEVEEVEKLENKIDKALKISNRLENKKEEFKQLGSLEHKYNNLKNTIKSKSKLIKELKSKLPDTCPLCGNEMRNK